VHAELTAARSYGLRINPRNRNGGYDGESLFECLLSEDEARVFYLGAVPVAAAKAQQRPAVNSGATRCWPIPAR
jgi:hypothetical protein